jgi:hypothetical protein
LWTALVLTALIEPALLAALGYRTRQFVAAAVLINIVTNGTLNLARGSIHALAGPVALAVLEVAVILIEWLVLTRLTPDRGRLLACVALANAVTFALGVVLW